MQYASRKDEAHAPIRAALEAASFFVVDLSRVGGGCPDFAISRNGCWAFLELKTPNISKRTGTPLQSALEQRNAAQVRFHGNAKGPIITAHNASEAIYSFNMLIKRREAYAL